MPELPEVEMLCRALRRTLVGREFRGVEVRLPKAFRLGADLRPADLEGKRVLGIGRRGKFFTIALSGDLTLVCHLRLSGQLVQRESGVTVAAGGHEVPKFAAPLPHKATRIVFELDGDGLLYYTDIRQFGFVLLMREEEAATYMASQPLGPDALTPEFTVESLGVALQRSRTAPLKTLLLNQALLSGLGNIYADESAYEARLHPLRRGSSLTDEEVARLHAAIGRVLTYATEHGLANVPHGKALGDTGFPKAHGREGLPCPECGTPIVRIRVNGRSTYFCARCQAEG
jgi:formamidopyrimidine-DNA glycosylase